MRIGVGRRQVEVEQGGSRLTASPPTGWASCPLVEPDWRDERDRGLVPALAAAAAAEAASA